MTPRPTAERDTDAPAAVREYEIWAYIDMDGTGELNRLVKVDTQIAPNHEAALRLWGRANPAVAATHTSGYRVITASAARDLGGEQETDFRVRPL